ncbi:MAG: DUF6064 family protein [Gammaproteobacteria bacterium]|nr:DUF6064 family protein [Gammaproteobacteria bacterium]MCW8839789.1 DUF6064 family protein [Gammaproteobacteria bacterium]MCW8957778.1 DUF6064 family protein [Gammaproteobacteria bacterium]MCW8973491.1 DUF6064 family protein [Gammaproteobacteria bacterium]MCW8992699.1 DUF6064 family protein [Gammaproteobacteria bacterium]
MQLPFSTEEFFGVFRQYNEAVWPAQVFLVGLALAAVVLVLKPRRWSGVGISAILAFLWAWLAVAYHFAFFTRVNPLAYLFAGVSLAGAVVFFWQGVVRRRLQFAWVGGGRAFTGTALVLFVLTLYPIWSWYAGHAYPHMPTFGLPCPTTLFTIGLLAFLVPPYPRTPFIVPVLWALVGAQAAFLLGVHQDLGLLVAAAVGVILLIR